MGSGITAKPAAPQLTPTSSQPWPSTVAAWYALCVIVFATFLNFFDASAFGLLIEQIRADFHLSNIQLGWLTGPANIIFYLIVLLPLSRLVDIYPRRIVLAIGVFFIAIFNAGGGLAIGFISLFASRMLVGAGGSAHAPGAYSMLADFFPPEKRATPFSVLQLGFILASTWGFLLAGHLFAWVSTFPSLEIGPIGIHGWKWVLLLLAIPGVIAAVLLFLIREPPRRGVIAQGAPLPYKTVISEVWLRRAVYLPMFSALAFSAANALALPAWLVPLFKRDFGWEETKIGNYLSPILFTGQMCGLLLGPMVVNYLAKSRKDANVRAAAIFFTLAIPMGVAAPMMPSGVLALVLFALTGAFGIASAAPQNLALQRITPNEMRGQVTGLYLMMFTAFGSLGPLLVGGLIDKVFGHDTDVWKALSLTSALLMPCAAILMWRAVKPYGMEVARLEALEQAHA